MRERDGSVRKVIFADDDAIVRKYLTETIHWGQLGFQPIKAVSTGREALELIVREQPDLAIIDIDMPDMDGVEVLQALNTANSAPNTKILILSCYNDFDYVKNAMRLGAVDYLLKYKTDSITLTGMVRSLFDENVELPASSEYVPIFHGRPAGKSGAILRAILNNTYSNNLDEAFRKLKEDGFYVNPSNILLACGRIDYYDKFLTRNSDSVIEQMNKSFVEIAGGNLKDTAIAMVEDGNIAILFDGDFYQHKEKHVDGLNTILQRIRDRLHVTATFGVAPPGANLANLGAYYLRALQALQYKLYTGMNRVIDYSALTFSEHLSKELSQQIDSWLDSANFSEKSNAMLNIIFERLQKERPPYKAFHLLMMKMVGGLLNKAGDLATLGNVFGDLTPQLIFFGCETCDDYHRWFEKKIDSLRRIQPKDYRKEIVSAIEYIQGHLNENLTLGIIAEHVNFSKTYFSQLFKQSTGENIVDYIARMRIEQAKKMLVNPNYKVYEVAIQVGFESQHYFNRIFKNMVGVTPTEYRYNSCYK